MDGLTEEEASKVVRCEMGDGFGQGFFVCVFARKRGLLKEERDEAERAYLQQKVKPKTEKLPEKEKKVVKKEKKVVKKEKSEINYVERIKSIRKTKHGKKVPLGCHSYPSLFYIESLLLLIECVRPRI